MQIEDMYAKCMLKNYNGPEITKFWRRSVGQTIELIILGLWGLTLDKSRAVGNIQKPGKSRFKIPEFWGTFGQMSVGSVVKITCKGPPLEIVTKGGLQPLKSAPAAKTMGEFSSNSVECC